VRMQMRQSALAGLANAARGPGSVDYEGFSQSSFSLWLRLRHSDRRVPPLRVSG
jgi:hypothetical protein